MAFEKNNSSKYYIHYNRTKMKQNKRNSKKYERESLLKVILMYQSAYYNLQFIVLKSENQGGFEEEQVSKLKKYT